MQCIVFPLIFSTYQIEITTTQTGTVKKYYYLIKSLRYQLVFELVAAQSKELLFNHMSRPKLL